LFYKFGKSFEISNNHGKTLTRNWEGGDVSAVPISLHHGFYSGLTNNGIWLQLEEPNTSRINPIW